MRKVDRTGNGLEMGLWKLRACPQIILPPFVPSFFLTREKERITIASNLE
jgi:hypothetical protein